MKYIKVYVEVRTIILDIEKVDLLYYEIAHDQYLYSDSEISYYKLSVAMDRMRNTVKTLNKMPLLTGKWNEDATEFVLWINYVDMLIASIDKVADYFGYSVTYNKNIFLKYHNLQHKTDKDFFRFIRAIVLPHALNLDDPKQKEFTNGKTAFCPFVVWETNNSIRIVYYNADIMNDLHTYTISITDIEQFVITVYSEIEKLTKIVAQRKKKKKANDKVKIKNELYDPNATLLKKCQFLKKLTIKYGDLDDKSGKSLTMCLLNRCEGILSMKFSGKNKDILDKYKCAVNIALDDYYDYLCKQSTDGKLLDLVLFPLHDYTSKTDFDGLGYEINKICTEMEEFDEYLKNHYFYEYYDALKPVLSQKVVISKKMSMKRICYLTIVAFFFDRVKYKKKYKEAFGEIYELE